MHSERKQTFNPIPVWWVHKLCLPMYMILGSGQPEICLWSPDLYFFISSEKLLFYDKKNFVVKFKNYVKILRIPTRWFSHSTGIGLILFCVIFGFFLFKFHCSRKRKFCREKLKFKMKK